MTEETNSKGVTAITGKKRELLNGAGSFNELVQKLMGLSYDVAKLEISNNDEASRRLRRNLIAFKNEDLVAFLERIKSLRAEISSMPSKPGNRAHNNMEKALSKRQEILQQNKSKTKNEN